MAPYRRTILPPLDEGATRNSLTAWSNSCRVFIMIGPYHTTSSGDATPRSATLNENSRDRGWFRICSNPPLAGARPKM